MDTNSAELIQELSKAQEDSQQWGMILENHKLRLRQMLDWRMNDLVRSRVDPSDVIQESFIEATKRLSDFIQKPDVPFYVWLRSLAVQKLAQLHRFHIGTQARSVAMDVSIVDHSFSNSASSVLASYLVATLSTPSAAAMEEEQRVKIQAAILELDPTDQEMIFLRHFEELSNLEIASVLGLKPTAASNRYVRALEKLKLILQRHSDFLPRTES